jgi:hypothetical protein
MIIPPQNCHSVVSIPSIHGAITAWPLFGPTERQDTALYAADYEVIVIFQYKIITYHRTKTIT